MDCFLNTSHKPLQTEEIADKQMLHAKGELRILEVIHVYLQNPEALLEVHTQYHIVLKSQVLLV